VQELVSVEKGGGVNCRTCNTPHPPCELMDRLCHRCTHQELVRERTWRQRLELSMDRLTLEYVNVRGLKIGPERPTTVEV
jgi:hypothetical protein